MNKAFFRNCLYSRGFTLVELIIVITIIGLLAAALFPSLTTYLSRARDTTRITDLKNTANAVNLYFTDFSKYPNNHIGYGSPQPIYIGSCISVSHWQCWGNPEPLNDLNGMLRPTRLVPKEYLATMPIDPMNRDTGDACSVGSQSWLYSYASNDISLGYILTTRLENIPGGGKIGSYTGTRLGCTGYANYGIVQGNGGYNIGLGVVGE